MADRSNNSRKQRNPRARLLNGLRSFPRRALNAVRARWSAFTAWLGGVSIDRHSIYKALICLGLVLLFALLETTFFGRFRPFGAVPDLMLPLVAAIGMTEGAGWGGAFGIVAGAVIDSLGNTEMTLQPVIFCLVGFFAGLLLEEYFSDMIAVRALMITSTALIRSVITLTGAASALPGFSLTEVFPMTIAPEFAATLIMGIIPHLAAYFSLKWAHRSRSEMTSN